MVRSPWASWYVLTDLLAGWLAGKLDGLMDDGWEVWPYTFTPMSQQHW